MLWYKKFYITTKHKNRYKVFEVIFPSKMWAKKCALYMAKYGK